MAKDPCKLTHWEQIVYETSLIKVERLPTIRDIAIKLNKSDHSIRTLLRAAKEKIDANG